MDSIAHLSTIADPMWSCETHRPRSLSDLKCWKRAICAYVAGCSITLGGSGIGSESFASFHDFLEQNLPL